MRLNAADRAAVDRVCGEIEECVVVVVSGRPLILTDQLRRMDALVAAWLPGSQGEGVADVVRPSPLQRPPVDDLAADAGAGADQRRRPGLRPAVPVRLGAADALKVSRLAGTPAWSASPT